MHSQRKNRIRKGAVALLACLLLIPLLAMLAFAIDAGWMVLVRTDLQNAADAAALAGAEKLQSGYVQYYMPGQFYQQSIAVTGTTNSPGSSMATAEQFAHYNKAGNVNISLQDQDITYGFTDASGNFTTSYSGFPNTVQVTVRRDSTANGPVGLFFGRVLGTPSVAMTATARATIYSGTVSTLQPIPGVQAHILPVALDYTVWDQFYNTGMSPDGTIHVNATNGYPELKIYPSPDNAPGNFGLIDVGPPQNNVPAFRSWIDDGETPNDISYLINNNLLPVSMASPQNWKAGPGLKSTLLTNFQDALNVPNMIPLFQAAQYPTVANGYTYLAASGSGQNATYAIVGFVGVVISDASGNGSNMNISVQPTAIIDPTAVLQTAMPAGTQSSPLTPSVNASTTITTFTSAKLTQ
ncbi:MAG TPA: pilus assembly protein TadG-related protein [Gemmataceae bacterium]|nr:pilus assembly protein TadG-related protein [Gemmataceae bacterium]